MQVYDLVVAKSGLKMKESPPEPPPAPNQDTAQQAAPAAPDFRKPALGADGIRRSRRLVAAEFQWP